MLKVERYNHENGHWIELNPINLFYLRWVIDNENNVFTFQGDLTRFEPQYFNIATMISEGNKKLLYPGIPNQGNVAGWKPEEWFKEGLFRYTIGVYGDNVRPSNNKNYEYNITIKFKQDGKISFYEER